MELIINNEELANQFQIDQNDLYVNDINNQNHNTNHDKSSSQQKTSFCKIKMINETHSRFKIPYQKCSTLQTVIHKKKIHSNLIKFNENNCVLF